MTCDKSSTPATSLLMPAGFRGHKTAKQTDLYVQQASRTMNSFTLSNVHLKGISHYNFWTKTSHIFFVRKDQVSIFKDLENAEWAMVVYPNSVGEYISDIREWIRNYPVEHGSVVTNLDTDFEGVTDGVGCAWLAEWHKDPRTVNRALLAIIRQFDHYHKKVGLEHAGANVGNHVWHPSPTSGVTTPIQHLSFGPRHFQESLSFESSNRPGHYPENCHNGEGLYRCATILEEYETKRFRCRVQKPLGYFDTFGWRFDMQPVKGLDASKEAQQAFLINRFGRDMVLRRSYTTADGTRRQGFNQIAAGADGRNRDKSSKQVVPLPAPLCYSNSHG